MTVKKRERIFYYDIIRFFAIFGVLATHVFSSLVSNPAMFGTRTWYYAIILNNLRNVGVPLFVVLSGALLITKKDSLLVFIKKRLSKVVVPYIAWMILFVVFGIICMKFNYYFKLPISELVMNTFSLNPQTPSLFFWFVPMILTVYVVIIIINKLYEYNENSLKVILAISLLIAILFNPFILELKKPYNYIFYSIFAILGYYLARIDLTNNSISKSLNLTSDKLTVIFLALSLLLYAAEIFYTNNIMISLNEYKAMKHLDLLNIALVVATFMFFRYFSESKGILSRIYSFIKDSSIGKIILSISICSYGIYLSHQIVRITLQYFLKPMMNSMPKSISFTIMLILTLGLSWLLILVLGKIPVVNKISGK